MRIVTWNMGCGGRATSYRKSHSDAWTYLMDELSPDVALVQEALVAKLRDAQRTHSVTICHLADSVDAGTAILSREVSSGSIADLGIRPGTTYAVAADVHTPAGALTVASAHVYPGKHLHSDLARIADMLTQTFPDRPVLIGGDFNAARRFDEVYGGQRHNAFFALMKDAGFHDIHWAIHGREMQSFWGRQAKEEYQIDNFFISNSWSQRVQSCNLIDNAVVRQLSDHAPLLLELDFALERSSTAVTSPTQT